MFTILGAGGAIANDLATELSKKEKPLRLVSRNPRIISGATEIVSADLSNPDQTNEAIAGSDVVFLVAGLKYDTKIWQELWPRIMKNTIDACKRYNARLIFLDNVYMYGKVHGPMTEETPFNPCSKKGHIRAQIATALLKEIKAGNLTAIIARSADFYGPGRVNSVANVLVFEKLSKGGKAMWFANDSVKHSFTFTPDAAKSLIYLSESEEAWNQTWHVPTTPNPPTGKEFIEMVAKEFSVPTRYQVLGRTKVKIAGLFKADVRESYEMLYQYESPYIFDSTKFAKAFDYVPAKYSHGIRATASGFKADITQPIKYRKKVQT